MSGVGPPRLAALRDEFTRVERILAETPTVDKFFGIPKEEFQTRQRRVADALRARGLDVGFVFSDEHYNGDVPYLGGNTNVTVEQVAGVIGPDGFHIVAGLEGGYVAEQLAPRAGARVHKVELLQLADEKYPIDAERLEDVIAAAAGGRRVDRIGLLTPRQVIPDGVVGYLENLFGAENVIDAQEIYYRIKYEKSDNEMRLIRDANVIADAMLRAMLAVLKPGMLETQLAAWAYFVGRELGAEGMGWDVIVGANTANRTLIGKALNRPIQHGDWVHLGVAPQRDGLNACVRRSVIAVECPEDVTSDQRYWFRLVEEAYQVGLDAYRQVAEHHLPARLQEQALVDFFRSKSAEVSARIGKPVQLERLKPYTGTHNAGYTECQEFFGAITLESDEPLGQQIVTMLDVALRGIGNYWDDVILPEVDFVVVENTLGKFGTRVEEFNRVPRNAQALVGTGLYP
ncbi:MAG: M24 family metallopeptidase [Armatimonadetes bacterium]|nr:M24 family metallopeptidase [Armatimonadota bacterium]